MPELWSAMFFLLIALAALTSTITFHEVLTEYFLDRFSLSRRVSATIATGISVIAAVLCLQWQAVFDFFDMFTADVLMPLGGLLTCIFAGWYLDKKIFRKEISNDGTLRAPLFGVLAFLLRWITPLLIGVVFVYNLVVHLLGA